LAVAAVACLLIFLVIPMLSGKMNKPEEPKASAPVVVQMKDPNTIEDFSSLEKEATPDQKSVNSPFIYGNEMVYSTGEASALNPELKNISIFDLTQNKTLPVLSNITPKYSNLFEPLMNDKWIVFLDVNATAGASRICGYNRKTNKMFSIREYYYGMPKLSLSGDYLAWMQQTAPTTDKLYICNLASNEEVCLHTYKDTPSSMSAVSICDKELVWAEIATGDSSCVIKRLPIADGKAGQEIQLDPKLFVFDPMTNGNDIIFLDGARGPDSRLMVSIDGALPKEIDKGVLNYGIGTNFAAYTKDDAVYV
jgi:hypothetical protein